MLKPEHLLACICLSDLFLQLEDKIVFLQHLFSQDADLIHVFY